MGLQMNGDSYVPGNDNRGGDEPPSIQPLSCRRLNSTKRLGSGGSSSGRLGGGGFGGRRRMSPQNSGMGMGGGSHPPHRSASAPSTFMSNGGGERTDGGMSRSEPPLSSSSSEEAQHHQNSPPRQGSSFALASLRSIQDALDFKFADEERHWQFAEKNGLGRTATIACILGLILGTNFTLMLLLGMHSFGLGTINFLDGIDPGRIQLLQQWLVYVVLLSFFHIAEFFVTAIWNPSVTTADSFVVNQSLAYTAAALVSWVEFWARFTFFPSVNSISLSCIGLGLVLMGQVCRTLAMVTCGQSFNHLIQISKKSNHDLVTHGIYRYLRHPSYFGFYWWSVGTQLLLGNPVCSVCYAVASWYFFKRRIPYEEMTLVRHFPDEYPEYAQSSWIGIPFIWSSTGEARKDE